MIWGPTSVGEWWTPCNVELLMLGSGWSYNLVQGHDAFIICFFSFLFLRCLENDMAVESNLQLPWAHHFPWTKTPIKMPCDAWLDHLTSLTCTEFPTRMCLYALGSKTKETPNSSNPIACECVFWGPNEFTLGCWFTVRVCFWSAHIVEPQHSIRIPSFPSQGNALFSLKSQSISLGPIKVESEIH
jgi:hypothetical protein